MNKLRICLAIPSLQPGGMERVMSVLANNFAQRPNVEVHLMMFGREREIFYDISKSIIVHKPEFVFSNKHRTLSTFKTIAFIRKEIRRIKPDSILSFGDYWNSLVLLSCLGLKYPVFVSDRGRPCVDSNKKQHLLRKYLYPTAKGVIAQTEKAKVIYQSIYKNDNMTIIGNPINQLDVSFPDAQREKIVLSVGRLQNTKNYDRLIRTFSEIDKSDWKLIIVGGDTMKQSNYSLLSKMIAELGMQDRIILAGNQKNVQDYYLKSSIFAFLSSSEGFPNVVGEAMAAGLPVVSYDCVAGPSEMIEDGENGFLVPVFDDEMMKEKIVYLMEHEEERLRMGEYARNSIKMFDKDIICQKFFDFITKDI